MIVNPAPPPLEDNAFDPARVAAAPRRARDEEADFGRIRAAELNATERNWHVMYGSGSRSFWAFPLWDPGARLILEDVDPHRLRRLMHETEARHLPR
ncbi:hypothetical protein GCM10010468_65350 [Actinocorallia longicatena]|uniref:Methyltransferase n=2 Tax=Actinocorallia longicatena TaxID=111803 RepID=A0ABP6QJ54_9ACTN